ncbi:MAG: acylphosphatase [Bacteroidales bacterium]|nr:acylphosphatase [Bacteroidales bacterium]
MMNEITIKNLRISITGKVQNVGFRYHTRQIAEVIGVYGYVKNLYDESVFIEVEGSIDKVNKFLDWCRKGPPRAIVENIEIENGEINNFNEFKVLF